MLRAIAFLIITSASAQAAEVVIHTGSRHLNTNHEFVERNPGVGVVWNQRAVGVYTNSFGRTSVYVARVTEWYTIGLVSGYESALVPMAMLTARIGYVVLGYVPRVSSERPAALTLSYQFKLL